MESKAELRSLSEIALVSSWSSFWRCPGSGRGGVESEYTITVERATREKEGEGEEDEDTLPGLHVPGFVPVRRS